MLDSADSCSLGAYNLDTFVRKVTGCNLLAESEVGDVNVENIGYLVGQSANPELAGLDEELTAGLHSGAVAEDVQRHVYGDRLVSRDSQEIGVDGVVGYRVELQLVQDGQIALAVDVEVHDVAVGGVGESLEVSCVH